MLEQIKQRRLSDIICENTDIATITDNVFIQVAQQFMGIFPEPEFIILCFQPGQGGNLKVECSAHRKLDLNALAAQLQAEL